MKIGPPYINIEFLLNLVDTLSPFEYEIRIFVEWKRIKNVDIEKHFSPYYPYYSFCFITVL